MEVSGDTSWEFTETTCKTRSAFTIAFRARPYCTAARRLRKRRRGRALRSGPPGTPMHYRRWHFSRLLAFLGCRRIGSAREKHGRPSQSDLEIFGWEVVYSSRSRDIDWKSVREERLRVRLCLGDSVARPVEECIVARAAMARQGAFECSGGCSAKLMLAKWGLIVFNVAFWVSSQYRVLAHYALSVSACMSYVTKCYLYMQSLCMHAFNHFL